MVARPYSTQEAADLFRQFGDGDSGFTLYYPDGTPADALNKQTNATPGSRLDYWSTHPDELALWQSIVQRENAAAKAAGAPAPDSQSLLDQIEADLAAAAAAAENAFAAVFKMPWGWLAIGALALFVVPPMLEGEHRRRK